jgi:hypothetical protein
MLSKSSGARQFHHLVETHKGGRSRGRDHACLALSRAMMILASRGGTTQGQRNKREPPHELREKEKRKSAENDVLKKSGGCGDGLAGVILFGPHQMMGAVMRASAPARSPRRTRRAPHRRNKHITSCTCCGTPVLPPPAGINGRKMQSSHCASDNSGRERCTRSWNCPNIACKFKLVGHRAKYFVIVRRRRLSFYLGFDLWP